MQEKLQDIEVAHQIVRTEEETELPDDFTDNELPLLSDGYESRTSQDEIKKFLEQLHSELRLSQSLQSDTCHLDPDNPDECL